MPNFSSVIIPTKKNPSIVILTGAGISAESGIATFRDNGGLWENHRVEDVATPEAFACNPELVLSFYNERRRAAGIAKPNDAHRALVELEKTWLGDFLLVTQNVDDLQEEAGSFQMLHMHGSLNSVLCKFCRHHHVWQSDITIDMTCVHCKKNGGMRPDIVWFGEMPYHMNEIEKALHKADYFVAIGTSGQVYPAAGFGLIARLGGARCFEVNLESTIGIDNGADSFDAQWIGPATHTVPEFVHYILEKQ